MAASAVLELKPEHGLFNTYSIQMACNHLALLLTTISEDDDGLVAQFVVWDWKAGTARLVSVLPLRSDIELTAI